MHAFIVTNQFDPTSLSVCEAVKEGITKADIKMGDSDWTSMVLFIPKDLRVSEKIGKNAINELLADETGKVASYAFGAGFKSLFSTKSARIKETNTEVIASEMADLIKGRSIRGASGGAKETVCSQLAIRILRASLLESRLTQEQINDYKQKNITDLRNGLANEMLKANSPVAELYASSKLFQHEADIEALPFELYRSLMEESDFHGVVKQKNNFYKGKRHIIRSERGLLLAYFQDRTRASSRVWRCTILFLILTPLNHRPFASSVLNGFQRYTFE